MTTKKPAGNYQIGRGKPPKHTRFKKGESGNPSGRPKAQRHQKSLEAIIRDGFFQEVTVTSNGKPTKMPALEAVILRQLGMALTGDVRSAKFVTDIAFNRIDMKRSLAELVGERDLFHYTAEDEKRFTRAKILDGIV